MRTPHTLVHDDAVPLEGTLADMLNQTAESRLLARHGMTSAALYHAFKNEPPLRRAARVTRLRLERTPPPDYADTHFYPAPPWGPSLPGDDPGKHGTEAGFQALIASLDNPFEQGLLRQIARDKTVRGANPQTSRHAHGGMHWVMNFPRLLKEGLTGYRSRVLALDGTAVDAQERAFRAAMLDTIDGLTALARNCLGKLKEHPRQTPRVKRLIQAFERIPAHPAGSFFEALAVVHFMIGLGCVEPGCMDQYLWPFYSRDIASGALTTAEARELLEEHFAAMDRCVESPGAWHLTLGGSDGEGRPAYNELTTICLELNRQHRQPNTSLRVRSDMPDHLWDTLLENLARGCGNPALVNERLFLARLPELAGVDAADLPDYGFGGCAETLVQGKSAVDSIGSTYNLLDILDASLGAHLMACASFEEFIAAFKDDIRLTAAQLHAEVNLRQASYGLHVSDPLRTLFTDDCIDRRKDYHDGGCRYNFEIVGVYGIANTVNSLYTLKKMYLGELGVGREELLAALAADFAGRETLRAKINSLDKFGNNTPELNDLARELTSFVFDELGRGRCWRGDGRFLPASIGWTDFIRLGKQLGATPDGRRLGEPLSDSTGPTQGTDRLGPTQTLLSSAAVAQDKAPGTCVLNLLLDPDVFKTKERREKLKALFTTYFSEGGCQLQVNVVDAAVLRDAFEHPERHTGLFVRIGGFNDYFAKQSRDIQAEIMERSLHRL